MGLYDDMGFSAAVGGSWPESVTTLEITDTLTVEGAAQFNGLAAFDGPASFTSENPVTVTGALISGALETVSIVLPADADATTAKLYPAADALQLRNGVDTTYLGLEAQNAHLHGTLTVDGVVGFNGAVTGLTKATVGLANVDNTADTAKPISTATQTALDLKAPLASPTFTGTVSGITASMVGLGNVDNTSDANKPVSTAQSTAIALKAPIASPTFTGGATFGSPAGWSITAANSDASGHGIFLRAGATANYVLSGGVYTDSQARVTIEATGRISIGDGTGSRDTNLYRGAANQLWTDDLFYANVNQATYGLYVTNAHASGTGAVVTLTTATNLAYAAQITGDTQQRYTVDANGLTKWGPGGSTAADTNLYRSGADTLKTDDALIVGGNLTGSAEVYARTNAATQVKCGYVGGYPGITFGSAEDTNLYRLAANLLQTDDAFQISTNQAGVWACTVQNTNATGHGLSMSSGAATNFGFGSTVVGDSFYRFSIDCAGKMLWGAGSTAGDISLYRFSSNVLQCDKGLQATNNVAARSASGQGAVTIGNVGAGSTAGILFGTDTNLYRSAADTLKTDDALCIGGNVGFYGTTPAAKPTVTGARDGNAALASLLTALANVGLLTDSSTA